MSRSRRLALAAVVVLAAAGGAFLLLPPRGAEAPGSERVGVPAPLPRAPGLAADGGRDPTGASRVEPEAVESASPSGALEQRRWERPPRPVRVHGRVVPPAGEPVPEGIVDVRSGHAETDWESPLGSSAVPWTREGDFEVLLPFEGAYEGVRLYARAIGFTEARRFVAVPDGVDDVEADVTLPAGEPLRGRVVDPVGRPVPDLLVNVGLDAVRAWWKSPVGWPAAAFVALRSEGWARTDARGEFRFRGLTSTAGVCAVAEDASWLLDESPVKSGPDGFAVWHANPAFVLDLRADVDDGSAFPQAAATFALSSRDGTRWGEWTFPVLGNTERAAPPAGTVGPAAPARRPPATGRWTLTRKSFPAHGRLEVDVRVRAPDCAPWSATRTLVWDARRLELSATLHRRRAEETGRVRIELLEPAASRLHDQEFAVRRREEGAPDDGWAEVGRFTPDRDARRNPAAAPPADDAAREDPEGWILPVGEAVLKVVAKDGVELCVWTGTVAVPSQGTVVAKVSFPPTGSVHLRAPADAEKTQEVALEEVGALDAPRRSRWIAVEPGEDAHARNVPAGTYRLVRRAARTPAGPTVSVEVGGEATLDLGAAK